jgi:hypothetical protein
MKLLFCPDCWDVIKLTFEVRSCKCGKVFGKYVDNSTAVVNGEGISLAIDNSRLPISKVHDIVPVTCYARPHTGKYNPNTKIRKRIKD